MNPTTFQMTSGLSLNADTRAAADEVVAQIAPTMAGQTDLVVFFFSPHHVPHIEIILSALYDGLAPGTVIGCSAAGVVGKGQEIETDAGLSVIAASWPGVELHTFTDAQLDWPSSESDPQILADVVRADDPALRGILLLTDPFTPLGNMLPALSNAVRRSPDKLAIPIAGGVASAGHRPDHNRLILNDEIHLGGMVGVSISGAIRMDTLVSQGCRPIGGPLVITAAHRNMVHALGGRPAMEVIRDIATDISHQERRLLKQGLFFGRVINEYQERFGRGDFLIRNVTNVDQERGSIAVSDFVRVGQTVQFHVRDKATASEDFELLLSAQQLDDKPTGGLLFTCNGRGQNLFDDPHHDAGMIQRFFPDLPLTGLFAAGEIGTIGNASFLHGHTASLALFRPFG